MASGLIGGGEANRGGVACSWTDMELMDLGVGLEMATVMFGIWLLSRPSNRIGIILSLGAAERLVALTAILISAF